MGAGEFGVQRDTERNAELLEQPPDAGNAPVDGVLAKSLVDQIRVAGRQIGAKHRAPAEAEFLDEQRKTDGDLFSAWPGGNADGLARKSGDRVGAVLRQARRRMHNRERQDQCGDQTGGPRFPSHDAPHPRRDAAAFTKQTRRLAERGYDPKLKVSMKKRYATFCFIASVDFYRAFQAAGTAAPNTRAANCG